MLENWLKNHFGEQVIRVLWLFFVICFIFAQPIGCDPHEGEKKSDSLHFDSVQKF